MKSTDNKKAQTFDGKGLIDVITKEVNNMNTIQQNLLNPNNQPLVIGEFSIRQDEDGRYCLNDLHKASGDSRKDRPSYFLENEKTQELILAITEENYDVGNPSSCRDPINIIRGRGKEQGTYVVKELVYSYAMWISAKFHLMVIRAYDAMVMQWKINDRQSISPEQQALLHEIVARRSSGERKIFAEMWSRHNRHFKIARYSQLLAIHFPEAIHYLETMDIKAKTEKQEVKINKIEIDANYQQAVQGLAWHMIWVREWWKEFGEPIRKLSPNMAGAVNDHFTDGAMFAFHFINQDDLKKQKERFEYHQWHLSCAERMALEYRNK